MQQSYKPQKKYVATTEDAKRVAQRLLKKYDKSGQGSIFIHDIQHILKDVYNNTKVTYTPNENNDRSYFNVLDRNRDQRICLEDLEQICIKYLCADTNTYTSNIPLQHHHQQHNQPPQQTYTTTHSHIIQHPHQQQEQYQIQQNQQQYQPQNIVQQQQQPENYNIQDGPRKVTSIITTSQKDYQIPQLGHQHSSQLNQPSLVSNASGYRGRSSEVSGSYLKHEDSQRQRMLTSKSKKINVPKGHSIFNSKNIFSQAVAGMSQERQSKIINQFKCKDATVVGYRKGPKLQQVIFNCKQTGQRFTDPEFPPNNNSLSRTGVWYDGSPIFSPFWIRPEEHFSKGYYLFQDGIMPGDIQQGYLGDCYFQCSLAALAEWPERIQRIFSTPEKSEFGAYSVWIVFNGVLEEVVVDDNFWYDKQGKTFVSMQSNGEEIWPQIIEKAWAKLNKDYVSIDGGFARDALHDLTGAPVIHYRIAEENKWRQVQELLWQQLLIGEKQNFVMCGATYGEDEDNCQVDDSEAKDGIFYSHAYSILAAYEIVIDGIKTKLCKLRNPHGKGEYTGKFSDRDPIWQRVSQSDKCKLDYEDEDDGVFFIEYERLRTYFEDIQVCQYRDHYIYEGLRVETGHGEQEHFFQIEIPHSHNGDGYYYFQVNQKARAEFGEDTNYTYTRSTVNVIDQNGNWVSAATGRQKNICSYLSQQQPSTIKPGTYYVLAKVLFNNHQAEEGIHSFGFGVYGKEQVKITPIHNPGQLGNIANALRQPPPSVNEILPTFMI